MEQELWWSLILAAPVLWTEVLLLIVAETVLWIEELSQLPASAARQASAEALERRQSGSTQAPHGIRS